MEPPAVQIDMDAVEYQGVPPHKAQKGGHGAMLRETTEELIHKGHHRERPDQADHDPEDVVIQKDGRRIDAAEKVNRRVVKGLAE